VRPERIALTIEHVGHLIIEVGEAGAAEFHRRLAGLEAASLRSARQDVVDHVIARGSNGAMGSSA
jgi:hypothetical protein